ncbi:uncharacterized protein LOC126575062 isoform X2 [Anopheles aquasalis]|uniref:uncharacterized protein LOC126575062 isoform X2 n=1 Tax=Anopheles aquasalis TaxID=42839 RepID=UPI00215AE32C|nr:uncharacterized protein LOC126575062 isoform X2 [Anopheles aquasalis]
MTPQHKPSSDEELVEVARPAVVNGFPLWIFENLDEDSDSTDEEYDSFCSRPTAAQERPATSSDRDSGNRVDSDSVNTVVQNDMNSRNAVSSPASQGTSNAAQDSVVDGSNGALNAGNPASGHGSSSIQSQKRTNKTADSTASHIPTAIFDTFNGDSDTTAEILEDLNSLPYDPISLNNIKHEMACSDNESGCTNRILNDLANGSDDGRSRFPSKQMKLHTGEGIVQISDFPPVTTTNSDGSSDLFSVSPVEDDCRQQLDMVESEPTQTSVEREQHTENVTHDRPITPPAQHTILGSVTTNESAIGKLQPNVGDFLRSTIEAKIQLHESLRSMLPGLFAKQVAESQQSDLLPLIVQKQFLINLVAAGLKRSYCRNADLGCIITIAAQLAYGNPDAACLLWRS